MNGGWTPMARAAFGERSSAASPHRPGPPRDLPRPRDRARPRAAGAARRGQDDAGAARAARRGVARRTSDRHARAAAPGAAIRRALTEEDGSVLAFLPGAGEIRRVERLLGASGLDPAIQIAPLYGDLLQEAQDTALLPAGRGRRKIVLATSIAETSLTIEG